MSELISVVMPVHNGGPYLEAAVESILAQTHQALEFIVVDDHSDDVAVARLDTSDPRLTIISSRSRGVVSAFNTGLEHCNGAMIARMDADDIANPRRLQTQLEYFHQHPDVDITSCCVEFFSSNTIRGGLLRYQKWLNSVRTPEQIHRQIFIESPMPNPGSMFRQAALQKLGGYRVVEWAEDYDLFLRADAAGMKMGKPEPVLLQWREHDKRLTHTDPVYSHEQFMRAKAHFLVNHRLPGRPFIIWGAGPTGTMLHDLLIEQGGEVEGFIEVHPRRIGKFKRELPVWPVSRAAEQGIAFVLMAVGTAGARNKIAAFMTDHQRKEGPDYLFVA